MSNYLPQILEAAAAYYNGTPRMTDQEFDALCERFRAAEPEAFAAWRSSYIGARPAAATPHPFRMLSLAGNDWHHFAEFLEWLDGMPKQRTYILQPKIDGHAVSVTYTHGDLTRVATRGDGKAGKDITGLALKNRIFPARLALHSFNRKGLPSELTFTGEIYIPLKNWNSAEYSHPRNELCAAINSADHAQKSTLRGVIHGFPEPPSYWHSTEEQALNFAEKYFGLPTVRHFVVTELTLRANFGQNLRCYFEHYLGGDAPLDGLVVKLNPLEDQARVGCSATAPRWAYALKEYQNY
jgi:DNA ligase (NAD+)